MTEYGRPEIVSAFMCMDLRDCDRWAHDNLEVQNAIVAQINHFPAFALPDMDRPSVICGFYHAFGCVTAWMLASKDFPRQAHKVLPMQQTLCRSMYRALSAQRMDIEVVKGFTSGEKWAERLGFTFEGVRARGGLGGVDISVYVWPFEERIDHVEAC